MVYAIFKKVCRNVCFSAGNSGKKCPERAIRGLNRFGLECEKHPHRCLKKGYGRHYSLFLDQDFYKGKFSENSPPTRYFPTLYDFFRMRTGFFILRATGAEVLPMRMFRKDFLPVDFMRIKEISSRLENARISSAALPTET